VGTPSGALQQDAIDKGYTTVGQQHWRNITSSGTSTWSGQINSLQYKTSSPNVVIGVAWHSCTFTLSANGQTLTVKDTDTGGVTTWTRK